MSTEHLRNNATYLEGTSTLRYRPATREEFLAAREAHDEAVAAHQARLQLRMAELSITTTPPLAPVEPPDGALQAARIGLPVIIIEHPSRPLPASIPVD